MLPPQLPSQAKAKGRNTTTDCLEQDDAWTVNLDDSDGILILSLKELFSRVKEQQSANTETDVRVYMIRCSYFEIYNDAVYDLLNTQKEIAFNEPLQLNEDIRVRLLKKCNMLIEEGVSRSRVEGVRCRELR